MGGCMSTDQRGQFRNQPLRRAEKRAEKEEWEDGQDTGNLIYKMGIVGSYI